MLRVALVASDERAPSGGAVDPSPAPSAVARALAAAGVILVSCADEPGARAALARGEVDAVLIDAPAEQRAREARRTLAHDLRGALALVRGHAELLAPELDGGLGDSVDTISAAVLRLAELVDREVEPPADD